MRGGCGVAGSPWEEADVCMPVDVCSWLSI